MGMGTAQAQQDERACLDAAARVTVERAWNYIGCMVSRGHTVGVAFHVRMQTTYIDVTQTRPHAAPAAATEIADCRKNAYEVGRTEKTHDAIVNLMETTFRRCLDPLGYTAQRPTA